jgi:hypothetical protein
MFLTYNHIWSTGPAHVQIIWSHDIYDGETHLSNALMTSSMDQRCSSGYKTSRLNRYYDGFRLN